MKNLRRGLAAAVCCWMILSGCRPVAPKVVLPPADEESLLQQMALHGQAFRSLQGMADIRADIEGDRTNARQVVLLEKPDQLRTEILGLFGQPVLRLAVSGKELAVHLPGKDLFFQGPATPDNLARFTLLPLGVEELVRLALYDVPVITYVERSLAIEDDRYVLRLKGGQGEAQIILFDSQSRLAGVEYYRHDELLLRVGYDRFTDRSGVFPLSVSLFMPHRKASLCMTYSDLTVNQEIPDERFQLKPPAGTTVRPLP